MSIRGLYTGGADDCVYFEHQAANTRLCGLHCLNNLLQGPVVTQAELARIGRAYDSAEQRIGAANHDYAQASADGYYGLDVIVAALQARDVALKHIHNPEYRDLLADPAKHGDAFILNLHDHWLAVRLVKGRWFSLDSLQSPEPISESRINSFVTTLQSQDWTLFVARPLQWPAVKMPEPQPTKHAQIPRVDDGPLRPAAFYSFSAISRLADAAGSPLPAAPLPTAAPPMPPLHEWPTGGGQTLGAVSAATAAAAGRGAGVDGAEDPELAEAMRLSVQEFKRSLKAPPPEPSVGGLMFKITDMTEHGSRGCVLSRRFPPGAVALDLFRWLFKAEEIWPGQMLALGAADCVILSAQFPARLLICDRGGSRVRFLERPAPTLPPPSDSGLDVTDQPLAQVFANGGESLRLSYAA